MTEVLVCQYCETPMERADYGPIRQYCTNLCRRRADRLKRVEEAGPGALLPRASHAPEAWDEQTRYSESPKPLFPYTRHCIACGRDSETEWISHDRAGLLGRAGLPPCPNCGGWRHMDPLDAGGIASATAARARRTAAEPVRPLPHGRVA